MSFSGTADSPPRPLKTTLDVTTIENYIKSEHWEKYCKKDNNHDYWENPAPEVLAFLESQSPDQKPMVLDIGCGIGRHAIEFAKAGYKVFASDNSLTAIEKLN